MVANDEGKSSAADPEDCGGGKDFAEKQRRAMREALGRRMKRELIDSEQERLSKVHIRVYTCIFVQMAK